MATKQALSMPAGWTLNLKLDWQAGNADQSITYKCWNCGSEVAVAWGYHSLDAESRKPAAWIRICHACKMPTFFFNRGEITYQVPGALPCEPVTNLEETVEALYNEARRCIANDAPTAATLLCRKILMHVAVEKGAAEGESFVTYVNYLAENGYVTTNARGWVDYIRTKGNEANHEVVRINEKDAEALLQFTEMLLRLMFEFPNRVPAPPSVASL